MSPFSPEREPRAIESPKVHSAFRDRKLFVWGHLPPLPDARPRGLRFAATHPRLRHAITQIVAEAVTANYRNAAIWLPTRGNEAIGGAEASRRNEAPRPWMLPVAILDAESALRFLDAGSGAFRSGRRRSPSARKQ